jgi:glycerol kinase
MDKLSLVLDIGTTGIKALLFNSTGEIVNKAYKTIGKTFPQPGWVEQDPHEILSVSQSVMQEVCSDIDINHVIGMGVTNQRETTILWDKLSGKPIYPAIVWEDARTKDYCEQIKKGHENTINNKTGLTSDSYFSASKINWILTNVPVTENLLFGTVDTWILWNLCKNKPHLTDCTNASRTLLYNIQKGEWDNELLEIFQIPKTILPDVLPSQGAFGELTEDLLGKSIPVIAVAGDQQSSLYAAGTTTGTTKVTYGTGAFLVQVLGNEFVRHEPFFTTLVPDKDCHLYAIEAKVAECGSRVTEALSEPIRLRQVLTDIAKEVDVYIKKLPTKPTSITIDGGAVRDGILKEVQEEVSKIPIIQQDPFDGTALGISKLIFDQLN